MTLRLAQPPDPVFTAILHDALEDLRDWIADLVVDEADAGWWTAQYPLIAARFTPRLAVDVAGQLLAASRDTAVYNLSEYHWLLLYDALRVYCDIHNDYAREAADGLLAVGPFRIGQIDFRDALDLYFDDLDILTDPGDFDRLGPEGRREFGMREELFGVIHRLPPHPDELRLPQDAAPPWDERDLEQARKPWPLAVPRYPPPPEPDADEAPPHCGPPQG